MTARHRSTVSESRRRWLASVGGAAALAPFLPLFNVSGQDATLPRRLVLFFTPHGTVWKDWRPSGSGTSFSLTSPILRPLAPFQKKVVAIEGLGVRDDGPGAPHTKGPALLFTASPLKKEGAFSRPDCEGGCTFGWNSGPSFDQVVAQKLQGATPFRSLEFGVRSSGGDPGSHIIYAGDSRPIPPRQDPVAAYKELFASRTTAAPSDEATRLVRRREIALGLVAKQISSLTPRVPSADRPKLQAHAEAMADLERQLKGGGGATCVVPGAPSKSGVSSDPADSMPWLVDRQLELMAASLRCDLTRVCSLQIRVGENDGYPYRFLGVNDEHHLTSHQTAASYQAMLTKIYTWYAERFAYLLELLDETPEGDGTMLDNTLVLWGTEVGTGYNHDFKNVPFVVAGGGAHGVRTGQYLKAAAGTYHNRLLVSAMRYMGLSDTERFGGTDQERGPLAGLGV